MKKLTDRKELLIRALRGRADVFSYVSDFDKSIDDHNTIIDLCRTFSDYWNKDKVAQAMIDIAFMLYEGKSDYDAAEEILKKALKRVDSRTSPEITARAWYTLGGIAYRRAILDEALEHFNKSKAICKRLKDKHWYASVCNGMGLAYWNKGDFDQSLKYLERYYAISRQMGDKRESAIACGNIGVVYHCRGDMASALNYMKKALDVFETIGDQRAIGIFSSNIGAIYEMQGKFKEAIEHHGTFLEVSEKSGFKQGIATACENIGVAIQSMGNLIEAMRYHKRALTLFREIGYQHGETITLRTMGTAYHERGKPNESITCLRKSLSLSKRMGIKQGKAMAHIEIGRFYLREGLSRKAREPLEKAQKILEEINDMSIMPALYIGLAELSFSKKKEKKAITLAEKALSLARKTSARTQEIHALRILGKVLLHDDEKQSLSTLRRAIDISLKEKRKLELAISLHELSKALFTVGKPGDARRYEREAKRLFKECGARWWMRKILRRD